MFMVAARPAKRTTRTEGGGEVPRRQTLGRVVGSQVGTPAAMQEKAISLPCHACVLIDFHTDLPFYACLCMSIFFLYSYKYPPLNLRLKMKIVSLSHSLLPPSVQYYPTYQLMKDLLHVQQEFESQRRFLLQQLCAKQSFYHSLPH